MFDDIPVDISLTHEGERIRSAKMFMKLAEPKSTGAELVQVKNNVKDGKIEVICPGVDEMKQGEVYPFAIKIEIQGKELEEELEGVIERNIHELSNYIEGFMHLNQQKIEYGK